jgi:hypothetical protein
LQTKDPFKAKAKKYTLPISINFPDSLIPNDEIPPSFLLTSTFLHELFYHLPESSSKSGSSLISLPSLKVASLFIYLKIKINKK